LLLIFTEISDGKGKQMLNREAFEAALHPAFAEASDFAKQGDWTRIIKNRLVQLAPKGSYTSASSTPGACHGEWLMDVCWTEYQFADHRRDWELKRFILAAEIEWAGNAGDILDDFEKLLFLAAEYRLLITQAVSDENWRTPAEVHAQLGLRKLVTNSPVQSPLVLCCFERGSWNAHWFDV
tara:strand:+ start:80 stop:622 length:543 start_codon:yes stop_codon:yes gene_type:complete